MLAATGILTPNESEACILLGRPPASLTAADAPDAARALLALGPAAVILKLGGQGCYYMDRSLAMHAPGFAVEVRDTTAAGDTFNAALAVALSEAMPIPAALRFANAASSISVTRLGAQASAPSRSEVLAALGA